MKGIFSTVEDVKYLFRMALKEKKSLNVAFLHEKSLHNVKAYKVVSFCLVKIEKNTTRVCLCFTIWNYSL